MTRAGRRSVTQREHDREQLRALVESGLSNADIALQLGVCEDTVARRVRRFGFKGLRRDNLGMNGHAGLNWHSARLLDDAVEMYWERRHAGRTSSQPTEAKLPNELGAEEC